MKKLLVLTMVAILALALTGCGAKKSAPAETLINWMQSGTYFMKYTADTEYEGQKTTVKASMAAQGDNLALNAETTVGGKTMKSRIIAVDGATYLIDDASKMIMKTVKMNGINKGMANFSKLEKIGSGKGEVKGRILPYEEYKSENFTIKYYMDGKSVYAIESQGDGAKSVMVIEEASKIVPAGSFDLPKDYKSFSF